MKIILYILFAVIAIGLNGCTTVQSTVDGKWEYRVIEHRGHTRADILQKELNELGEEGWLVISTNTIEEGWIETKTILKRQK